MIQALKQIIIYVDDVSGAVDFYHRLLGLPLKGDALDDYAEAMWVELDGGGCTLALHGGGEAVSGSAATPVFAVEDVEAARSLLTAHDIPCGKIIDAAPGTRVFGARDPAGNPISFKSVGGG